MFLGSNPVVQQSRNESLHSVSCARKSSELEFVCAFLKSPGIGERLSQKLCNLLMHFLREFAENARTKCTVHICQLDPRSERSAAACIPLWPSEITRPTFASPLSFRSEKISSQVDSSSESAILAPRISRNPSLLIPAITKSALLTSRTPSLILKYEASTNRYGMYVSIGRERNRWTFWSSSAEIFETYEAEIFSIPRWATISWIFRVETPWR